VGRNFANKLWNAVRFALSNLEEGPTLKPNDEDPQLSLADRWILSRLATTVREADRSLSKYEFNTYAQGLYDFIWRDLCDWYIEAVKPTVRQNASQCRVLALCIDATLRLLHPVMPFVTEKLWERLNEVAPHREISGVSLTPSGLLVHASWPKVSEGLIDKGVEADFALLQRLVSAVREARATYKISPKQRIQTTAKANATLAAKLVAFASLAETLTNIGPGEVGPRVDRPADAAVVFVDDIELYLHNMVDADAERTRLTKQLADAEKSVKALEGRLANPKYVDKAPPHLVNETREQLAAAKREEEMLRTQLAALA
jgi:valyl-tRNA synthetase